MFYTVKARDFIRVPPSMFDLSKVESVLANVKSTYNGYISKDVGFVVNAKYNYVFDYGNDLDNFNYWAFGLGMIFSLD